MLHRITPFALIAVALVLTGCASWTTYPPIPGAAQLGRPDYEPGPAVMAEAIRYVNDRHMKEAGIGDIARREREIIFNLPEGIPAEVYDKVAKHLGEDVSARPMTEDDRRAIHVTGVRIRAFDSEVDVVYPRPDGMHEMIMLSMRQNLLNRHRVIGSRLWRIHVTAPPAHYVAPPTIEPLLNEVESVEVVELETAPGGEQHSASAEEIAPEAQVGVTGTDPAEDP